MKVLLEACQPCRQLGMSVASQLIAVLGLGGIGVEVGVQNSPSLLRPSYEEFELVRHFAI